MIIATGDMQFTLDRMETDKVRLVVATGYAVLSYIDDTGGSVVFGTMVSGDVWVIQSDDAGVWSVLSKLQRSA